jgi:CheY-like chemotaxis protein
MPSAQAASDASGVFGDVGWGSAHYHRFTEKVDAMRPQRHAHFNSDLQHTERSTRLVLYVEDHVANALLMHAFCSALPGVQLLVAPTGEAGLRAAAQIKADLLLLDLNLPDCHGVELLERMRLLPGAATVPAVAVTAEETFDLAGTGFHEIWFKPLDTLPTLQRLQYLLGLSDMARPGTVSASGTQSTAVPSVVPLGASESPPVTVVRNWARTRDWAPNSDDE